jgi:hypothetical protein
MLRIKTPRCDGFWKILLRNNGNFFTCFVEKVFSDWGCPSKDFLFIETVMETLNILFGKFFFKFSKIYYNLSNF